MRAYYQLFGPHSLLFPFPNIVVFDNLANCLGLFTTWQIVLLLMFLNSQIPTITFASAVLSYAIDAVAKMLTFPFKWVLECRWHRWWRYDSALDRHARMKVRVCFFSEEQTVPEKELRVAWQRPAIDQEVDWSISHFAFQQPVLLRPIIDPTFHYKTPSFTSESVRWQTSPSTCLFAISQSRTVTEGRGEEDER